MGMKPGGRRQTIFDYTRLMFWVGLILLMYVLASLISLSSRNTAVREKADIIEEDIIKLESEIDTLNAEVTYYQTDAYKERLAREKLGLQMPGEKVVIVGRGDADRLLKTNKVDDTNLNIDRKSHIEEWGEFLFGEQ
ncbi:septum formation initiator family protein [Candidatus Saccharibacteria bacterium]|nr:septum formation initiator family protein [Candidatus Saccharibacteria bacterium]